ncbi:unnamed protein product [Cylicostephanus goldi]|uniref:Uncharacterized protein n=1 Tax=Cylicostephanus goldi TaxID=71465 RepID=A0A3P6T3N0_CYLGO|nr:unnamed protein product [Cylicostephanus goldi]
MEEKCILAMIMRNLRVRSLLRTDQMRVAAELIIRPLYGNQINSIDFISFSSMKQSDLFQFLHQFNWFMRKKHDSIISLVPDLIRV